MIRKHHLLLVSGILALAVLACRTQGTPGAQPVTPTPLPPFNTPTPEESTSGETPFLVRFDNLQAVDVENQTLTLANDQVVRVNGETNYARDTGQHDGDVISLPDLSIGDYLQVEVVEGSGNPPLASWVIIRPQEDEPPGIGGAGGGEGYQDGAGPNAPTWGVIANVNTFDQSTGILTLSPGEDGIPDYDTVLVDANTVYRIGDITNDGALASPDQLTPGTSVQVDFAEPVPQDFEGVPLVGIIWVRRYPDPGFDFTEGMEVRSALIRSVDAQAQRFILEPQGEVIVWDDETQFVWDDDTVLDGIPSEADILQSGLNAEVVVRLNADGTLYAVRVIVGEPDF